MAVKKFVDESKKTWEIATPAILTAVFQYSLSFISSAFAGHIGDLELAAVSVSENVLEGFVFGVMLGMGSALETLCGQAVGAGKPHMLGIYMQRSCIITFVTALCLVPVYVFSSPLLQLLRQDKEISQLAGKFSIWVLPQVFAYAFNFPVQKFLQSQTKVWVMTIISAVSIVLHLGLNFVFVTWLDMGLVGVALAGNISWWFIVIAQFIYVTAGFFPEAWTGFSLQAFKSLSGFVKLSLASAVMLCLELWYYTAVILMVGGLKDPKIAVDAVSICMNFLNWAIMINLGFNASVSVRVSNEIGAGDSKAAVYSVRVNLLTSTAIALFMSIAICGSANHFPLVFSHNDTVVKETTKLTYLLASAIFLNGLLPVLHGVAVGAGWQVSVAFINLACYYVLGLPVGALLGFKFGLSERGVWIGMLIGCVVQLIVLLFVMYRADWNKEVVKAEIRMKTYDDQEQDRGNSQDPPQVVDLNNSHDLPASTRS